MFQFKMRKEDLVENIMMCQNPSIPLNRPQNNLSVLSRDKAGTSRQKVADKEIRTSQETNY
jgi:hypothetical protein